MRSDIPEWKLSCIGAVILTGLAFVVVFVFKPGGFETHGAWVLVLLPGVLGSIPLSDLFYKYVPRLEPILKWTMTVGFNLLWYWLVSSIVIKIRRAL